MIRIKPSMLASIAAAALLATAAVAPSIAHDVEKGPHGGPLITVEDKHLELTAKGPDLVVYVTDAKHEPLATTGGSGRAIVQAAGKTATVVLAPADGGRLVGKAETAVAAGARVVVSATLPGKGTVQGRFVVK